LASPQWVLWMCAIGQGACCHKNLPYSHCSLWTSKCLWYETCLSAWSQSIGQALWSITSLALVLLHQTLCHSCCPHQQHQQPLSLLSNLGNPYVHSLRLLCVGCEFSMMKMSYMSCYQDEIAYHLLSDSPACIHGFNLGPSGPWMDPQPDA
jgi:hypothetical protein